MLDRIDFPWCNVFSSNLSQKWLGTSLHAHVHVWVANLRQDLGQILALKGPVKKISLPVWERWQEVYFQMSRQIISVILLPGEAKTGKDPEDQRLCWVAEHLWNVEKSLLKLKGNTCLLGNKMSKLTLVCWFAHHTQIEAINQCQPKTSTILQETQCYLSRDVPMKLAKESLGMLPIIKWIKHFLNLRFYKELEAYIKENNIQQVTNQGNFPFNKNSNFKFRKVHVPNGTVHSSCTDPTQATVCLVFVLVSKMWKNGTGDDNFVKWKRQFSFTDQNDQTDQSGPPSKLVPNILVGPNQNGPFHLMYQLKFPEFGLNGKRPRLRNLPNR